MIKTIFVVLGMLISIPVVLAQEDLTVSIINIHRANQLILIDAGQGIVNQGDVFELINSQDPCRFEVVQVHEGVSNIKPILSPEHQDSCDAFTNLQVMDRLIRRQPQQASVMPSPALNKGIIQQAPQAVPIEAIDQPASLQDTILKLRFELAAAIKERNALRVNLIRQDKHIAKLQLKIKELSESLPKKNNKGVR